MNKKLAFIALLLMASSGLMLLAEFSKSPATTTQISEITSSLNWQFDLDKISIEEGSGFCFILCTNTCECVSCCPNGSGGFNCTPVPPPRWCNPI